MGGSTATVQLWGAGGGGGGAARLFDNSDLGGGGSGGAYTIAVLNVNPVGKTYAVEKCGGNCR